MTLRGQEALAHLRGAIEADDPAASSHWKKYHAGFQVTADGFAGLEGFGGCTRPYRGVRGWLHRQMQARYRQLAEGMPFFETADEAARQITRRQNRAYDLDVLRQSLTLAFLRDRIPTAFSASSTWCVIGDGFASMTSLLLATRSAGRVVLVNLDKTLLVDLWYLRLWLGDGFETSVELWTGPAEEATASESGVCLTAIRAVEHERLKALPIDGVINIASMQEMTPSTIAEYFADLRAIARGRPLHFYCCNREEKRLPDGTVTRFAEYPWQTEDEVLVDERCPWHQHYYTLLPPRYRQYDGPLRHRLVCLRPSDAS